MSFVLLLLPVNGFAAEVEKLSESSASWDGAKTVYPQGEAEITAIKILLKPGDKMPFHCHPVPIVGYVIGGTLQVETMSGEKHVFKKGDTINEVVNRWHRGVNISKEMVELVGFYAGVKGTPTTIMYSEENKGKCKE